MKDFTAYSVGIVYASACSSLSLEETAKRLNAEHPTGVGPWTPSEDATFSGGQPNPCPCNESPDTHKHYLFNC